MRFARSWTLAALAVLAVSAGACSPIVRNTGNMVEEERVAAIEQGRTSQAEVARLLGSPSAVSTFENDVWYYIGQRTETTAFLPPEVVARKVLIVHFDRDGIVSQMEKRGMDDAREIQIADRETPTLGQDRSMLAEFFGNIGRFSGKDETRRPGTL